MKKVMTGMTEVALLMVLIISIIHPQGWAHKLVIVGTWIAITLFYWIILAAIIVIVMEGRRQELTAVLCNCFAYSRSRPTVWVVLLLMIVSLVFSSSFVSLGYLGSFLVCYYLTGQQLIGVGQ